MWEAIDRVKEDAFAESGDEHLKAATELSVWLHTEFQCKMEEADQLLE